MSPQVVGNGIVCTLHVSHTNTITSRKGKVGRLSYNAIQFSDTEALIKTNRNSRNGRQSVLIATKPSHKENDRGDENENGTEEKHDVQTTERLLKGHRQT